MNHRFHTFLPNLITLSRIGFAILVMLFVLAENINAAVVAYTLGALTDALDGKLARHLKQETASGRLLDALADRAFLIIVFIGLTLAHRVGLALKAGFYSWLLAECVFGLVVYKKTGIFYLTTTHRNSIRIAATFSYIVIGLTILGSPGVAGLVLLSWGFGVLACIDYVCWIQGRPFLPWERLETRLKQTPYVRRLLI